MGFAIGYQVGFGQNGAHFGIEFIPPRQDRLVKLVGSKRKTTITTAWEDNMINTPKEIFATADMVMHVKAPLPPEYDLIREGQIVFTYLHLAADENQTRALIKSKSVSIAYVCEAVALTKLQSRIINRGMGLSIACSVCCPSITTVPFSPE